jgi:TIGR00255 family protein
MILAKGRIIQAFLYNSYQFSYSNAPSIISLLKTMITSMTGYAITQQTYDLITISIELKSVNHRYLTLSFKLPEEWRFLEHKLQKFLSSRIARGKVECRLCVQEDCLYSQFSLNHEVARQLLYLNKQLLKEGKVSALSVGDILRFPGVMKKNELDVKALEKKILSQLEETFHYFSQTRTDEGKHLKNHLLQRITKIDRLVQEIFINQPARIHKYSQRLKEKLEELLQTSPEAERFNQEIIYYLQKIDIDEELSRLQAHIKEATQIIISSQTDPIGKRLDFMMQELNRETNTLASKSAFIELSQYAIELKVLIEQMREQIQNIE